MESAASGLTVSLLVRQPGTEKLYVNFDQSLFQFMKEADHFRRMGFDVPQAALRLLDRSEAITANFNLVKVDCSVHEQLFSYMLCLLCSKLKSL